MIDLYTANTPNGYKISILLEETGIPYNAIKVDLEAGEQRRPEFLKINPNGRIPAIYDREANRRVFESGAILIYLAEMSGRFLPADPGKRIETLGWLFFQVGHIGPTLGQLYHFRNAKTEVPYALERFGNEARRVYGVLESRLADHPYLGGDEYTIADIAAWPWMKQYALLGIGIEPYPGVKRWIEAVAARPAAQKGITVPG